MPPSKSKPKPKPTASRTSKKTTKKPTIKSKNSKSKSKSKKQITRKTPLKKPRVSRTSKKNSKTTGNKKSKQLGRGCGDLERVYLEYQSPCVLNLMKENCRDNNKQIIYENLPYRENNKNPSYHQTLEETRSQYTPPSPYYNKDSVFDDFSPFINSRATNKEQQQSNEKRKRLEILNRGPYPPYTP